MSCLACVLRAATRGSAGWPVLFSPAALLSAPPYAAAARPRRFAWTVTPEKRHAEDGEGAGHEQNLRDQLEHAADDRGVPGDALRLWRLLLRAEHQVGEEEGRLSGAGWRWQPVASRTRSSSIRARACSAACWLAGPQREGARCERSGLSCASHKSPWFHRSALAHTCIHLHPPHGPLIQKHRRGPNALT